MRSEERQADFHPQDWIIVIEAFAQWVGVLDGPISRRGERAYDLIEAMADEKGLPVDDSDRRPSVDRIADLNAQEINPLGIRYDHRDLRSMDRRNNLLISNAMTH